MSSARSIELLAILILVLAIAVVGNRRIRSGVWLYGMQSLALGCIAALIAQREHAPHIYIAAAAAILIKAIAIPNVIIYVMARMEVRREVESYLGIPSSLLVAASLSALAFYATDTTLNLGMGNHTLSSTLLGVSLACILIGFFLMINRKKALSQVLGLSVMENGLFLAAIALTSGMPLVIELGVFFELLVGIMLMGILIFKIKESFDTISTDSMRTLKD